MMVRSVVLSIVVAFLLGGCTTVGDRPGGAEEAVPDSTALGALSESDRFGEPGPDRASLGGVVFPVPEGWNIFRIAGESTAVKGTIRSVSGQDVFVGSFPIGHDVTNRAFLTFVATELFQAPAIPAGEYIQTFDDDSFYAGVPFDTSGSVLRMRAFHDGTTIRFLASLVSGTLNDDAAVTTIISRSRLAREGESVYRRRSNGINVVETAQSGWLLLDDLNDGATLGYMGDDVELIVSLASEMGATGHTERLGQSGEAGQNSSLPFWIGTDRVMATTAERKEGEWRIEEYVVDQPLLIRIELFRRGVEREERLLQAPEVQGLFRENLWLGGTS